MTRVIIIDDEPLACRVVREFLKSRPELEIVAECHDGFEGVKAINEHSPDLIFLDVQMPKITGFEMLELLENVPSVIFTTAFEEYAIRAFEANAVDYLLKPFSLERFNKALDKFLDQPKSMIPKFSSSSPLQQTNRIVLRDEGKIRIIPFKDISVLEADDDYVKIRTVSGNFMKKITLAHYEQILPPDQFIRVHRSFLLHVAEVLRIEPYEKTSHVAILRDGSRVPVSKSGYQRLRVFLGV